MQFSVQTACKLEEFYNKKLCKKKREQKQSGTKFVCISAYFKNLVSLTIVED